MTDCEELIRPAIDSALDDGIYISADQGDCRVTVPFERSDRDSVTLWIVQKGETYHITDEGETYGMLYLSNINLDQERRANRLQTIKERFKLENAKYEVSLTAEESELGSRLLDAIQAVQSISYLAWTRQKYTYTDFRSDVGEFLTQEGFYYTPNYDVRGASDAHIVDFNVHEQPQPTYVEAIHAESTSSARGMAQKTAFKWTDIAAVNEDVKRISVLDNQSGEYDARTENILENYSDVYVPWSNKDDLPRAIRA